MIFSLLAVLMGTAHAEMARMTVEGMVCVTCQDKITQALDRLDFMSDASASTASNTACATLTGSVEEDKVKLIFEELGYQLKSIDIVPSCNPNTKRYPNNWEYTDGLDVTVISRGEMIDIEDHRPEGKWTIFDFGAPWCAPCHAAEKMLKIYLRDNPDTALKAIVLDSHNAKESFGMPIAQQYLQNAPGLPFFIVMDPKGKTIFKGSEVDKLLKKLDKQK